MCSKFFFLSLVVASFLISSSTQDGLPEYEEIDANNPYVVDLGKFAVSEHNKKAPVSLVFLKIQHALVSRFTHSNYILVITAQTPFGFNSDVSTKPRTYVAKVDDSPKEKLRRLVSFIAKV